MNRRFIPFTLAAAAATTLASAQSSAGGDWILSVLRSSMETKKGITLHVRGQSVSMLVTNIGDQFVEGRSQQASRIVVRLASIDAAILV